MVIQIDESQKWPEDGLTLRMKRRTIEGIIIREDEGPDRLDLHDDK